MEGVTINTLAILPYNKVNIRAGNEPSRYMKFHILKEVLMDGFVSIVLLSVLNVKAFSTKRGPK